jgi:S1-C subfamily serine protease
MKTGGRTLPVFLWSLLLVAAAASETRADDLQDIKSVIYRVTPFYDADAIVMFNDIGKKFYDSSVEARGKDPQSAEGLSRLSRLMNAHARGEHLSGSGWLFVDPTDQRSYIITNAHVIGGGYSVSADPADGSAPPVRGAVVYVDEAYDLAVIAVENRAGKRGFELELQTPRDGTPVWAAGFPSREWSWEPGTVTNGVLKHHLYETVIGHGSKLALGSSGGPLLLQDPQTRRFRVVGINTWQIADGAASKNIAIPARYVLKILAQAQQALRNLADHSALKGLLEHEAKTLAAELSSPRRKAEKVFRYFSYAMIGIPGNEGASVAIATLAETQRRGVGQSEDLARSHPADFIRLQLARLWLLDMIAGGQQVEFEKVVYSDEEAIGREKVIRTRFRFGQTSRELGWTYEHGHWRLASFDVDWSRMRTIAASERAAATAQPVASAQPVMSETRTGPASPALPATYFEGVHSSAFWVRAGSTTRDVVGMEGAEKVSVEAASFGLGLELFQSQLFSLGLGLTFTERGAAYSVVTREGDFITVDEKVQYVQFPVTFRVGHQWSGPVATLRLSARLGLSADLAVERGASGSINLVSITLGEAYFQGHRDFNLGLVYGVGLEVGFGQERRFFVGFDALADRHLMGEWQDNSLDAKYTGVGGLLSVKYEFGQ